MGNLHNQKMSIKLKQGLAANINATATKNIAVEGEPHWATDTNQLYIFDGTQNLQVPTLDSNNKYSQEISFAGEGSGLYFGHMYTNSTIAVTITDTTPVEVGDTFTTGEVNGVSFGASHYLDVGANGAGKYRVEWDISASQNTPSSAIEVESGVMIDSVAQAGGRGHRTISNSTDIGCISGHTILDLAANEQVSLFVVNQTNGANIDVQHANLVITMVGGA